MEFILIICLAAFALGLGFVALLRQKTYLDATSGTVTAVEVPFVGKLQTNHPALVFVFIGLAFGYLAYRVKADAAEESWTAIKSFTVSGQLKSKDNVTDWSSAEITVLPSSLTSQHVNSAGQYQIVVEIPKWQSFDKWLNAIIFQSGALSGRISPHANNDTSKINKQTESYLDADVNMKLVE